MDCGWAGMAIAAGIVAGFLFFIPGGQFVAGLFTSQPLKFSSTAITKINISGDFLVFDGQGTVNGKPGYTFEVSATDGGPAGSGQDTILVQFYGPNSFTYNAPATIAGGDVVVHE
jgi:hypothetical protein